MGKRLRFDGEKLKRKHGTGLQYAWAIGREIALILPKGRGYTTGVLIGQKPYQVHVEFSNGRTEWLPKTYVYAVGAPVWKLKEK